MRSRERILSLFAPKITNICLAILRMVEKIKEMVLNEAGQMVRETLEQLIPKM